MCARLLLKTPHRSLSYMLRHEFARRCIDAHVASERPARIDPVAAEHPARGGRTTGPAAAEHPAPQRPNTLQKNATRLVRIPSERRQR